MEKKRILIVEDDNVDYANIEERLSFKNEFELERAGTTKDAEAMVKRNRPDLIIMDIRLELEDSGIWLIRKFKKDPTLLDIPIIAFSQYGNRDDMYTEIVALGVTHILDKSSMRKLEALVRELLQLNEGSAEHQPVEYNARQAKLRVENEVFDLALSKMPSQLLEYLSANYGLVCSYVDMTEALYGEHNKANQQALEGVIRTLKDKLRAIEVCELVHNHHGIGYQLKLE